MAHFATGLALGFEGHSVALKVHPVTYFHQGKSSMDNVVRCDTLDEIREFMHKRAIVALAGVMGETIVRPAFNIDLREACQPLEHGETGASLDHAVAKMLAQLLDNSSAAEGDGVLPLRGAGSMKVFQTLCFHAAGVVQRNAVAICRLADLLASRARCSADGFIEATLSMEEIELYGEIQAIQCVSLPELVCL